ncbi:MAG: exodeoxyribonuclease VII large subunit [Lachnospiraceae bacterium]|nr:exodeoxyribonuclease VII large subunit [Lachnospiraceae bacterium]
MPKYALTVGVVTAPTGAALQDIIRTTALRNPYVQLILSPARVQGTGAAESIAAAIQALDRIRPDVMIVGRGGGSQEDLWCFNEEIVARAIYACETPVISAVGHEVDVTIADFAADYRAATPTAAAEAAVFLASEYLEGLMTLEDAMTRILNNRLYALRLKMERDTMRLRAAHPKVRLERYHSRLTDLRRRSFQASEKKMEQVRNRLKLLEAKVDAHSPLKRLTGGFGYVEQNGKPVRGLLELISGDLVTIRMRDARAEAEILRVQKEE